MTKLGMLALCAGLTSCVHGEGQGNITPVSTTDIINKLRCELYQVAVAHPETQSEKWVVSAGFEFSMDRGGNVGPEFSATDTISNGTVGVAFPFGLGRKVVRTYEQTVGVYMELLPEESCSGPGNARLGGDLGVAALVKEYLAVRSSLASTETRAVELANLENAGQFSGSTAFTVTRSLGGLGPTWTLTHFTGPGAFLSLSDEAINKVTMVVLIPKPEPAPDRIVKRKRPTSSTTAAPTTAAPGPTGAQRQLLQEGYKALETLQARDKTL